MKIYGKATQQLPRLFNSFLNQTTVFWNIITRKFFSEFENVKSLKKSLEVFELVRYLISQNIQLAKGRDINLFKNLFSLLKLWTDSFHLSQCITKFIYFLRYCSVQRTFRRISLKECAHVYDSSVSLSYTLPQYRIRSK